MNTNLNDSIDIISADTDISRRQQRFYCIRSKISGAFFEFPEDSQKGHRFFIGVFRKLSNKFEPDILEQVL